MKTSVLKSSLVMLVLFAVAGSGVAQAQECIARASSGNTVRAEGITEVVGGVELLCRQSPDFGFGIPDEITLSIELNTSVTNAFAMDMEDDRVLADLDYSGIGGQGAPTLGVRAIIRGLIGKYSRRWHHDLLETHQQRSQLL